MYLIIIYIYFKAKKIGKFKDWLGIGTAIDIKASTAVIEILSYLAYETVNEVRLYPFIRMFHIFGISLLDILQLKF